MEQGGGPGRGALGAARQIFQALGHREFRTFWLGAWCSNSGTWMQAVAQGWLVTQLTGSSFWVGMVGFAGGLPALFLALPAGELADRVDRRRLLLVSQSVLMLLALALAYRVQTGLTAGAGWPLVRWIMAVAFLSGVAMAVSFPAWQAMIPDLVPRDALLNAVSLNSAQFHAARLVGPALAGALMARVGIGSAFWANAVSYLAVLWALALVRPRPPPAPSGEGVWRRLTGGLRYARRNLAVAVLLLSVCVTTFFGLSYATLLPLLVKGSLGGGSAAYANLMAANGLGAVAGALGVAALGGIVSRRLLIRGGLLVFSVSALAIALSRSLWLTAALMPLAGAAFLTMQAAINTGIQLATPPELRGRVMALFVLAFMGIMPLGSLAFGALGAAVGVPRAIAFGEAVCLAWGVLLVLRPRWLGAVE